MKNAKPGVLYIVATPIGNLQDITLRAIEVLKKVDRIAAEDTRHSAQLLKHYSIEKPTTSFHDFNEEERSDSLLNYLLGGEEIALISDAGTPLISDPGFFLVRKARENKIPIVPIPGPCAAIAALSVSGFPTREFCFQGFLPAKEVALTNHLLELQHETRTMIFYEAPHRLLKTLEVMSQVFTSHRKAAVARELTKMFESVLVDRLEDLLKYYRSHLGEMRGEIVIIVEGETDRDILKSPTIYPEKVLDILLKDHSVKEAARIASEITAVSKNKLYALALSKNKLKS